MIYLGNCHDNIQVVAEQWELKLNEFLFKVHEKKLSIQRERRTIALFDTYYEKMKGKITYNDELNNQEKTVVLEEVEGFRTSLRRIVLAGDEELKEYSLQEKKSKSRLSNNAWNLKQTLMEELYEDFTQSQEINGVSNSHFFFRELNIRTCPYCNRHYTFTLDEEVKAAPEFDHFYDKANHPLLAVSFYNLIPSCHTCNHIKMNNIVKINPYFSGFRRKFELQDNEGNRMPLDEIINQKKEVKIGFGKLGDKKREEDEQENINTFGLQGLYEMHDDYINEIVEKTIAYNPTVRQALVDSFQDQAYSPQQVFDFVWGRYLDEVHYDRKPLSKLKRDILEQLGMLPKDNIQ